MSVGTAKRKGGRAAHLGPERRRPQFLDAALALVAREGVHAVHMEAVARATGVTKPAVYACFGSREELLGALLEREALKLFEGVMSALPKELDLEHPERVMTEGFSALFGVVEAHRDSWRLLLSAETDPAVGEQLREGRKLIAREVSRLAESWLKARKATDIPRRLPVLVTLFMSICEGMVRSLLEGQKRWTPQELGDYVGRIVLAAFERS